jgi:hypothetical protein
MPCRHHPSDCSTEHRQTTERLYPGAHLGPFEVSVSFLQLHTCLRDCAQYLRYTKYSIRTLQEVMSRGIPTLKSTQTPDQADTRGYSINIRPCTVRVDTESMVHRCKSLSAAESESPCHVSPGHRRAAAEAAAEAATYVPGCSSTVEVSIGNSRLHLESSWMSTLL